MKNGGGLFVRSYRSADLFRIKDWTPGRESLMGRGREAVIIIIVHVISISRHFCIVRLHPLLIRFIRFKLTFSLQSFSMSSFPKSVVLSPSPF